MIWSELELNQPLGFFRPTLIHLSYPTRITAARLKVSQVRKGGLPPLFDWVRAGASPPSQPESSFVSSYPDLAAPAFAFHLLSQVTIIVHVHEQVLAPLSSRLCVVTKHDAFEFHAQRRL